jgi:hypothetical protein
MSITKTYEGLKFSPGERVRVIGEAKAMFTVLAYATNDRGQAWYELFGGPKGRAQFRSITPERLRRASGREVTKFYGGSPEPTVRPPTSARKRVAS